MINSLVSQNISLQALVIMMGCWMMLISIGALISGYLSQMFFSNYTLGFSLLGGLLVILGLLAFSSLPLAMNKLLNKRCPA